MQDGKSLNQRRLAMPMINRAGDLATEDSDAFDEVMASFGLPKSSEQEKQEHDFPYEQQPYEQQKYRMGQDWR